jgi:hypothetical protein
MKVDEVSDRDVVDAILTLFQEGLIALGRYTGMTFIPYDVREGTPYFYGPAFRCTPLPKARRRQQELAEGNRHGIFISHVADEKPLALRLQRLLLDALFPVPPVFVSSDYQSIESGDEWYRAILAGLKRSKVIIVLLSNESIERRWINFEAGFGLGQGSRVIPVVWRGLAKADMGLPLGQLQARDLHDGRELLALLQTTADVCHVRLNDKPTAAFLKDLVDLQNQILFTGLEAIPFRKDNAIFLAIRNSGGRPLDMIDAELLVPDVFGTAGHAFLPVRELVRFDNKIGFRLTTIPSSHPHSGIEPLRATLVKDAGEVLLKGLTVPLPRDFSDEQAAHTIRYRVSARQMTVGPVTVAISDLPRR